MPLRNYSSYPMMMDQVEVEECFRECLDVAAREPNVGAEAVITALCELAERQPRDRRLTPETRAWIEVWLLENWTVTSPFIAASGMLSSSLELCSVVPLLEDSLVTTTDPDLCGVIQETLTSLVGVPTR